MGWLHLSLSVIAWVTGMVILGEAESDTEYSIVPTYASIVCFIISFGFMELSLRRFEFSAMYTTWIGTGLVILSILSATENGIGFIQMISILLISVGVAGMHFSERFAQKD